MREEHEGQCKDHSGGAKLAKKVLRHGYYWPTALHDAKEFVRR